MMRVFFCLELDSSVKDALSRAAGGLKRHVGGAKWVAPENLHVTIRFIGEVEEETVAALRELGGAVSQVSAPFSFTLSRVGAFPSPRQARVIWAGPEEPSQAFAELVREVEAGVVGIGLPPETKPAALHVTLARLKPPRDILAAIRGLPPLELAVEVDKLTLMRSQLTPQGPIYTPLERWKLGE